jgi:hypothetical protein
MGMSPPLLLLIDKYQMMKIPMWIQLFEVDLGTIPKKVHGRYKPTIFHIYHWHHPLLLNFPLFVNLIVLPYSHPEEEVVVVVSMPTIQVLESLMRSGDK